MAKEWDPETLLDVLGDDLAREILVVASDESVSASELAERCDASQPTIYRRVNALREYDLLSEETEIDSDGHHYKTFATSVDELTVTVDDDGIDVGVESREESDKFEQFWGSFKSELRQDEG